MKSSNLRRLFAMVMALVLLTLTLGACAPQAPGAGETNDQASAPPVTEETTQATEPSTEAPTETSAPPEQTEPETQSTTPTENQTQTTKPATEPTQPTTEATQPPTEAPTEPSLVCYITIDCLTILPRMADLTPGKEGFVPQDGYILGKTAVPFTEGETVFDVLLRVTRERGIHMEHEFFPVYKSEYIEGINQLYEFDCGPGSGWMYYVNGYKPNYGVSKYVLQNGDNIQIRYTCDLGNDL